MKKLLTLTMALVALFVAQSSFATIIGPLSLCVGSTTTLIDSPATSGTWTSSTPAVATVGVSTGVVTGITAGTSMITYWGPSTSWVTVTVNPAPTSIGGGTTPICVGTTATLTCSPAGGTWTSYNPSVASVGAATGVATGISVGYATIRYTLPGGCYASHTVTVSAGGGVDSVTGASSVCVGSTITLSASLSGTWSSSSPGIATISGGGVVTGLSIGTTTISHATSGTCGTAYSTHTVTVMGATTSAGTISGPTSVGVGGTISLSSTIGGGTWSTATTSIATVSSGGVVSGVAVGTAIITYTVTGCGSASSTYTVTVTATNCIQGTVHFGSGSYYGPVRVWLIKYNPTTHMLTACDSQVVYCSSGTAVTYSFCGMATDSFRVKAARDSMTTGTGYVPTYHTSSAYWNTATVINHTSGTTDLGQDINMLWGTTTSGPGFIAGDVMTGANKGTSGSVPVVGMLIYCVDASGAILQSTTTNASGAYSFTSLPASATGTTYTIYPEAINYATTPFTSITLTAGTPAMTAAHFIQHTISMTITPGTAAVGTLATANTAINVFPNPASGSLNVQWNIVNAGNGTVAITDVTGRVVMTNTIDMTQTNGNSRLDISGIKAGLYMVSIKANGVNYNAKVVIE